MAHDQDAHDRVFAERLRAREAQRAMRHIKAGSQPMDTEDFVEAIEKELREGESTYTARARIRARVAALAPTITENSPAADVAEFLHLHRFARQPGACWSKAKKRYRAERGEAIPTAEFGNDDALQARKAELAAERAKHG